MARARKFTDKINNAGFENIQLTAEEQATFDLFTQAGGLGYYQNVNLQDIVNNFIASYVGEDKAIKKVPRHEVAFHAQRCVANLNFDVLYAEKNIELELNPDTLTVALPSDFVNYVKITWTDLSGNEHTVHPSRRVNAKQAIIQDTDFNYIYDQTGEKTLAANSEGIDRFQDPTRFHAQYRAARNYYFGYYEDDDYSYFFRSYFGRRYGNEPQYENINGTFVIDPSAGIIYFDYTFALAFERDGGRIVSLRYVTDGLSQNDDLNNVFVHKFAEDAVYADILYNVTKVRPTIASLAPLYKKEAMAHKRNAKIRLSQYKLEELAQVMRQRSKWIKH